MLVQVWRTTEPRAFIEASEREPHARAIERLLTAITSNPKALEVGA